MADVRFLPPQDVARTAFSLPARSKTHHGSGDRHADGNSVSKLSANEFVSVRLPELPSAVQERFNAIKMTRGHGAFGPRLSVLDTMTMKQKLMEEHVQHLTDEYNNVKAVADGKAKQLEVMNAQASSTSDVCGEITDLSSNMEVYLTALQQRCDIVCSRLDDTHTHMECMRINAERLNSSNRAMKVRTDAIKNEIAKGESKFKEARRLHQVLGKASQAAQEEFQRVRSLLLVEADERQAQLDHRTSIWQFQQQLATDEQRERTADEQARAALTTASSVATAREERLDVAVELEQMLVARAPLQEQLKWDRQQPNTVVAGMARLEGTFGCTGADAVIQRYENSRQRLQQLEQLRGDLETRTETLSKRRDDLQNLLNGLRIGVVSASSDESRSALDEDAQELARFAKDIDIVPVRVSPQDERLAAAAATIARLQPTVARFDSLYLKLRHWMDTMASKLDVPLQPPTQQPDAWCNSSLSLLSDRLVHMRRRLEGAGVPVSNIPMQPLGMAVLEGSVSPGYRRRMSTLAASPAPAADLVTTDGEGAAVADTSVADAGDSPSQPSPPPVPPIDVSNFVVTMSMASHSLQSPPRFDSRIDGVVPCSPRGMPVWDFKAQMHRDALENDDDDEGSDDDAAVDVLFNDDGSRNVPCRDEEELARERERKAKLTDKQMDEVLKTVPKVPPKPRRGDFNSAM